MGDRKTLGLSSSLLAMKMISVLMIEFVSLMAMVPEAGPERPYLIVFISGVVGAMAILLIFDRTTGFTMIAGLLMISSLLVASILKEFEVLALWGLLSVTLFSVVLGVAASGQSKMVRESAQMDSSQERLFLKEMLRSVGISLIAIISIMIISLATLSLTFLAELGLSSAVLMGALAIVAIISLGALVAVRHRF